MPAVSRLPGFIDPSLERRSLNPLSIEAKLLTAFFCFDQTEPPTYISFVQERRAAGVYCGQVAEDHAAEDVALHRAIQDESALETGN